MKTKLALSVFMSLMVAGCNPQDIQVLTEDAAAPVEELAADTSPLVYLTPGDIVTSGLVLQLDAVKANGTAPYVGCAPSDWLDLSASANTSVLSQMTSCSDGVSGWSGDGTAADPYSLAFDGTDDSAGDTGGIGLPTGNAARSVLAWIKRSPGNAPNGVTMIFIWGTANTDQAFGFGISNDLKLYMGAWDNDLQSNETIMNDSWVHIAVTHDGTTVMNSTAIKGYLNGVPATMGPAGNRSGQVFSTTGTDYMIGANPVPGYNFKGKIAAIHVYNRTLTAAEVLENCEADADRFQGATCGN
jgi:hypothetical protein